MSQRMRVHLPSGNEGVYDVPDKYVGDPTAIIRYGKLVAVKWKKYLEPANWTWNQHDGKRWPEASEEQAAAFDALPEIK